jgi:hypothetical protein
VLECRMNCEWNVACFRTGRRAFVLASC